MITRKSDVPFVFPDWWEHPAELPKPTARRRKSKPPPWLSREELIAFLETLRERRREEELKAASVS